MGGGDAAGGRAPEAPVPAGGTGASCSPGRGGRLSLCGGRFFQYQYAGGLSPGPRAPAGAKRRKREADMRNTSGLNADGQHDHIMDTCVPTFTHYNILLLIGGFIGGMFL